MSAVWRDPHMVPQAAGLRLGAVGADGNAPAPSRGLAPLSPPPPPPAVATRRTPAIQTASRGDPAPPHDLALGERDQPMHVVVAVTAASIVLWAAARLAAPSFCGSPCRAMSALHGVDEAGEGRGVRSEEAALESPPPRQPQPSRCREQPSTV
eukprot:269784-Chlamydomonas_euryale.AAC.5